MAHTKTGGTTKGNRDSKGRRLGVKVFAGTPVIPGNIIVRQRGTKIHPGDGVKMGKDNTLFAITSGIVNFKKRLDRLFVEINPA